ncbi:hypothetical protein [Pelobium manganitolerans]|uniref:hypothetical protein n=1 Tax=Pelobium manganitolerans TaxID=1842495 RepID=UPI003FA3D7F3
MSIQKFALYYILLLALSSFVYWALNQYLFPQAALIPFFWLAYAYMALITLLVYGLSVVGIKMGGEYQSTIILGAIVVRLLLTLCFLMFYILKVKVDAVLFVANFFSIYLLFTVFEIYCLLRNLRDQIRE